MADSSSCFGLSLAQVVSDLVLKPPSWLQDGGFRNAHLRGPCEEHTESDTTALRFLHGVAGLSLRDRVKSSDNTLGGLHLLSGSGRLNILLEELDAVAVKMVFGLRCAENCYL